MAVVELTSHLFTFFPDLKGRDLHLSGKSARDIVDQLEALSPGIAFYLCDELGELRQHVNIFIGDERVVDRKNLSDKVGAETRILIMQALSGG